jgi:hypothetical protein
MSSEMPSRGGALAKVRRTRIQEGGELDPAIRIGLVQISSMAITTWAFVLGTGESGGIISLDDGDERAFFDTREAAIEHAQRYGMAVDGDGTLSFC